MDATVIYRGKITTSDDIEFIKKLIADNPSASRYALSKKLCKEWHWVQANGHLRDMVCRSYMLNLHRLGYIDLPAKKTNPVNPLVTRKAPSKIEIDQTPIRMSLSKLLPLEIRQVRGTSYEKLFNSLIHQHHYLGYCHPVGEHLKYIVFAKDRPIACLAWSSAPRHIGSRDKFIGWSADFRKKNIHLIAYNSRFLVFNWVRVPNLASHILGQSVKILPLNWQRLYKHPIYFLETFVDTERFSGICYKAANWRFLGVTTGRGKNDQTKKANRSIKAVFGYPLSKNFREVLQHESA